MYNLISDNWVTKLLKCKTKSIDTIRMICDFWEESEKNSRNVAFESYSTDVTDFWFYLDFPVQYWGCVSIISHFTFTVYSKVSRGCNTGTYNGFTLVNLVDSYRTPILQKSLSRKILWHGIVSESKNWELESVFTGEWIKCQIFSE